MSELKIIGGRGSHDELLEEISRLPPGKVLDAPAGTGALASFLRGRGWDVHCADIDPGLFRAEGFPLARVNLNRDRLPHPDGFFDAVVCANGLHRLFNPAHAAREFHRVLRSGGVLHITVNNYASILKRLRFLFYGSISNAVNEGSGRQTVDDPEAGLRHHLFYPQLARLLEEAGFRIALVRASAVRRPHRLLLPLAWIIRAGTVFIGPRSARRNRIRETRSGAILPGGRYIYVQARKPE
jgi:SAM-dependent methyltransferase